MSQEYDKELELTRELFAWLQGEQSTEAERRKWKTPKLSSDQAWSVIHHLGNLYWQVPDAVDRCDVCGDLYHSSQEGRCLDFGRAPYHFCESCMSEDEFVKKNARNPDKSLR